MSAAIVGAAAQAIEALVRVIGEAVGDVAEVKERLEYALARETPNVRAAYERARASRLGGRRIHVDQGRRGTNAGQGANFDIIRLDDAAGAPLGWGGTIRLGCSCGREVGRFVQTGPGQAHVELAPHASAECVPLERTPKEGA